MSDGPIYVNDVSERVLNGRVLLQALYRQWNRVTDENH
jgi:hypothetical protein